MDYNISYRKKDKSIQCIISYKDENDKWKQKSKQGFKTQKEYKPWIESTVKELENKIKLYEKMDPALKDLTFNELVNKFIAHKKIHRELSTIITVEVAHKKFKHLDNMIVTDISKADAQYCVDLMVKEGLAISTVKANVSRIKTVFNYAIEDIEIIEKNPLEKVTIPENKKSDEKIKALTKSQLENLLNGIEDPTLKLISMIAGTCGLRLGEILGLNWGDIDLKNSTLTVNKQWKVIKKWSYGIGDVKRKKSNRTVPIPEKTLDELKMYKNLYPIHTTKRIFYKRISTSSVGTDLSKIYKSLGYDISAHDLRHTYATNLIANGVDFKTTARLMGHDVQETIKTYSHVTDDMIKNATEIIEKIF